MFILLVFSCQHLLMNYSNLNEAFEEQKNWELRDLFFDQGHRISIQLQTYMILGKKHHYEIFLRYGRKVIKKDFRSKEDLVAHIQSNKSILYGMGDNDIFSDLTAYHLDKIIFESKQESLMLVEDNKKLNMWFLIDNDGLLLLRDKKYKLMQLTNQVLIVQLELYSDEIMNLLESELVYLSGLVKHFQFLDNYLHYTTGKI